MARWHFFVRHPPIEASALSPIFDTVDFQRCADTRWMPCASFGFGAAHTVRAPALLACCIHPLNPFREEIPQILNLCFSSTNGLSISIALASVEVCCGGNSAETGRKKYYVRSLDSLQPTSNTVLIDVSTQIQLNSTGLSAVWLGSRIFTTIVSKPCSSYTCA